MATTKTWIDYQSHLELELKQDSARLSETERDFLLSRAAELFSHDRPRITIADIPATGAFEYDVPADWDPDASVALQVEFPAGAQTPQILPDENWLIYQAATGTFTLRFLADSPGTGTIRLTYTIPHRLTEQTNTVPDAAFMAVIYKAAQLACEALAAQFAKTSDPTLAADVVNYRTKSQEYADRAKDFEAKYEKLIGKDAAVGVMGEWDLTLAGGSPQLFHKPRWR